MTKQMMRDLFISTLRRHNQIFDNLDESNENSLRLTWNGGDNLDEIDIFVNFSVLESGALMAHIGCYDLPNFSDCYDRGVRVCNQLNDDELVKYYIDEEGDAVTTTTLLYNSHGVPSEFSPEQVLSYANTTATSVDDVYPILINAKRG